MVVALLGGAGAQGAKVATFYENGGTPYARAMHRVFQYLAKGDYDQAWTERQTMMRDLGASGEQQAYEQALYPLIDLSDALFEAREAGQGQSVTLPVDPWTARQQVQAVYDKRQGIAQANVFLGDDEIGLSVDLIRQLVNQRTDALTKQLLKSDVTLTQLDHYAATTPRTAADPIMRTYDNLINLPTHSYRLMSLKLNFANVTGRVDERVTESTGNSFASHFVFNAQGLLTEQYNGRSKTTTRYAYGFTPTHGFYLKSKTQGGKTYNYQCTYDNATGRLKALKCTDGTSMKFTYDERGRLLSRTEVLKSGKRRTSTFNKGKIRNEVTGQYTLNFLGYDGFRVSTIDEVSPNGKNQWTYDYELDAQGRWTKAAARLDGRPRITVTRTYSGE